MTKTNRTTPDNNFSLPLAESFYSIQGEGYNSGKAAYFIRLAGCDVNCSWCDAKETWKRDNFSLVPLEDIVDGVIESGTENVVITGGEPLMCDLTALCYILKERGMNLFLETSGTSPLTGEFDWICLSPKQKRPPIDSFYYVASELKVIIASPEDLKWAEECGVRANREAILYLQPEWSVRDSVLPGIVDFVKKNPRWRVSMQIHKFMNIP